MPLLPAKANRYQWGKLMGISPERKSIKSNLSFLLMVPNFVYKFLMICLKGTYVIELKPNVEHAAMGKT